MGGRSYAKGDKEWMRPQDMQALIDTGAAHWADEKPKAPTRNEPRIWGMTVAEVVSDLIHEKSAARLGRWLTEEGANPRGARKGVLTVLEQRINQLGT